MKKYLKKLLCSIFAISILLVSTIHVNAATPYKVISDYDGKTKVGNYYILLNSEKGIYVSKSKSSSSKKIVNVPKSSDTKIAYTLLSNGSKIYYGIVKNNYEGFSAYMKLYRIDVSGKNNVYMGKINHGESLSGYYNGNVFVETSSYYGLGDPTQADTYIYNLDSKKLSLVKREFKIDYQNGKYILGSPYRGDANAPLPIHVYNASTKKIYKITSKGCYGKFINGKVYYAYGDAYDSDPSKRKISVKTSSYTGKNQKTLCTINMKNGGVVLDVKSSYVEYIKYNDDMSKETQYRCYYSSGKVVKIKDIIYN